MQQINRQFSRMGIALALALSLPQGANAEAATLTSEVSYGEGLSGYLARPEEGTSLPAVLLIHEWWGLNEDIRQKAREFAEEGYVALAVDLYGGRSATDPDQARELAGEVRGDMEEAFRNLGAGISYLREAEGVAPERIASVGWCFGGGWSYQIAKNDLGARASVIYYGPFNPEDDLDRMRTTILGHFAEEDRVIHVSSAEILQATLELLSGDHEVFIYPNASHGFANPLNERAYDADAAALAWERTLDFLERQL